MRELWQRWLAIGAEADDDGLTRSRKRFLVGGATTVPALLFGIGAVYLASGEPLAGWTYCVISAYIVALFALFAVHHRLELSFWLAAVPSLLAHLTVILSLGDIVHSGAILLWGLAFPVATGLVFVSVRKIIPLFAMWIGNLVVCTLVVPSDRSSLSSGVERTILFMNLVGLSVFAVLILALFVSQRDVAYQLLGAEQRRARALLLNILPEEIADELARSPHVIADAFDDVSVLFADVVGFTPMSEQLTPTELVELLDELFGHFDGLVECAGLEKIKTIGDAYMVAAGVPRSHPDHAQAIVALGLQMQAAAQAKTFHGRRLELRIGVNSGSVVAGVIGRRKFSYDLWGDVVNTASRMESHGVPGGLQVTAATHELIRDRFDCEPRGLIEVRGKGPLQTWMVTGARRRPRPNRLDQLA
ncbi:MAG: adenylate cyclase [Pseudonocardiales bacterium]|jgi:guanylate cyclase|nr:adenylate cyclase [Pseudonocardiales bacterium]